MMTVAGVITVAVSLCVLGGSLLLTRLVDHGTQRWQNGVEFIIFMDPKAPSTQTTAVQSQLKRDHEVRSFKYLSHQDAYNDFKRLQGSQGAELVDTITPADLPESFLVAPVKASLAKQVSVQYRNLPGVQSIDTADKAVKDLLTTSKWIRFGFLAIFLALLFASLFLIVNTIRLATYARRREIEVMKLVGASNWFVRVPFMLEGMVQGVAGAAIGAVAVLGAPTGAHRRDPDRHRLLARLVRLVRRRVPDQPHGRAARRRHRRDRRPRGPAPLPRRLTVHIPGRPGRFAVSAHHPVPRLRLRSGADAARSAAPLAPLVRCRMEARCAAARGADPRWAEQSKGRASATAVAGVATVNC